MSDVPETAPAGVTTNAGNGAPADPEVLVNTGVRSMGATTVAQAANLPRETSAERAASVKQVIAATSGETSAVKQAALNAVAGEIPPPTRTAADIAWIILVGALSVILVLSLLGLTHVLGRGVNDDKVITIFTACLAGLLGLFTKPPGGSSNS